MIGNNCFLAAALAFGPLAVQASDTYTFDSITGIEHVQRQVLITGVLVNDSTPTTIAVEWTSSRGGPVTRCEALLSVVLSQPAAFRLTVTTQAENVVENGVPLTLDILKSCASQVKP
jgi:hypothetical protein